ncbi:MAG TPA: LamG-like jellyroll fold domain-containing protein, partial [bacterium]|nr:LamG-like jellyroll fold domain-containing protein [bacterium]
MKRNALLLLALLAIGSPVFAQSPTVRYAFAGNANDLSGNGRHGTAVSSASIGPATLTIPEDASSYLSIPVSAAHGLNDFTVTAAVQLDPVHAPGPGAQLNVVLAGANAADDNALMIAYQFTVGSWRVEIGSGHAGNPSQFFFVPTGSRPGPGIWQHIAYVRRTVLGSTTGTFYLNGAQLGSSISLTGPSSVAPLNIAPGGLLAGQEQDAVGGAFQSRQSLKGSLGELTIY